MYSLVVKLYIRTQVYQQKKTTRSIIYDAAYGDTSA
nr:MAG TPA: hypothetical protein [Caudoviricetes sp.]